MRATRLLCFLGCIGATACTDAGRGPGEAAPVAQGSFATVSSQQLPAELLRHLVAARGGNRAADAAAEDIVHDALLARAGREVLPHRARTTERAVLLRALLEAMEQAAVEESPLTEKQREAKARELWLELDRPQAFRVIEVFSPSSLLSADSDDKVDLMQRLQDVAESSATLEEFQQRGAEIAGDNAEIQIRRHPPLTSDGRVVPEHEADQQHAPPSEKLVDAVSRLERIGDVSPVFGTSDGLHFVRVVDIVPPKVASQKERRLRVEAAIAAERSRDDLQRLLKQLKSKQRLDISDKLSTLTGLVWQE